MTKSAILYNTQVMSLHQMTTVLQLGHRQELRLRRMRQYQWGSCSAVHIQDKCAKKSQIPYKAHKRLHDSLPD